MFFARGKQYCKKSCDVVKNESIKTSDKNWAVRFRSCGEIKAGVEEEAIHSYG